MEMMLAYRLLQTQTKPAFQEMHERLVAHCSNNCISGLRWLASFVER
jgi:hypothetical protein